MAFKFKEILTNLIIEDSRYDVLMNKFTTPKKKGKKARMTKDVLRLIMNADPTTTQEDEGLGNIDPDAEINIFDCHRHCNFCSFGTASKGTPTNPTKSLLNQC